MARKTKPLTVKFYLNGEPVDRLTPETIESMMKRVSERMSQYYTLHLDEFQILLDAEERKKAQGQEVI